MASSADNFPPYAIKHATLSLGRACCVKLLAAIMLLACLPGSASAAAARTPPKPDFPHQACRVLVVNFDPLCPAFGNQKTHELLKWNDPRLLAREYLEELSKASGGWCKYRIASWYDANYHPLFEDDFCYAADDFIQAFREREKKPLHTGPAGYVKLLTDKALPHNQPRSIVERVAEGEIDEVFFFGAYGAFGVWEASMAGPKPFFVNGGVYPLPQSKRDFVIMGFNYERAVDCMLENFCHRTECTLSLVYKPKDFWFATFPPQNNWDRFRMLEKTEPGKAAVGICHFAPNSKSDYDWGNETKVYSTCDDWLYNWPNLKGDSTRRLVDSSEWGGGDMRKHHTWWLAHLPRAPGLNPDGKLNNWWRYVCDFQACAADSR